MKNFTFIYLFIFPTLFYSQVGIQTNTPSGNLEIELIINLKQQFSLDNLNAYKDKAEYKLKDFYEYLTLYSKTEDDSLRIQIKDNIYDLVQNKENLQLIIKDNIYNNEEIFDYLEKNTTTFEIKEFTNVLINLNYFEVNYILLISENNFTISTNQKSKIEFINKETNFGNESRKILKIVLNFKN